MKRIKGREGLVSSAEWAVSPGDDGGKWKKASQHRRGMNEKEVWDEKKMKKTGESWIWRHIHSLFARVCATASQAGVSQSAGGRRGSDFLLKEQSNKLSYNTVVAMVATADPTKKPTRVYILCPRLLLTMGGEWGRKKRPLKPSFAVGRSGVG